MPNLDKEDTRYLSRIMTMGSGTNLPVVMGPGELVRLIGVIYQDLGMGAQLKTEHPDLYEQIFPTQNYAETLPDWFLKPVCMEPNQHIALLSTGIRQIPDFKTYLRCLCELHKRRQKYARILQSQPLPTMVQIAPRALIEYGNQHAQALASWLTWRKFFYDLDNRAAQETGYLFEPILAAAIGGTPQSAASKVVRRTHEPSKGRQVDCWKVSGSGKPLAYEFKLRVTIAASGQGRFKEEISFAEDVHNAQAIPVLLVLDPTMNHRLAELQNAYEKRGGHAYLGDAAWKHLQEEAGPTMARFIALHVRHPMQTISEYEKHFDEDGNAHLRLLPLQALFERNELILRLGAFERRISRMEDEDLSQDTGTED